MTEPNERFVPPHLGLSVPSRHITLGSLWVPPGLRFLIAYFGLSLFPGWYNEDMAHLLLIPQCLMLGPALRMDGS